MSRRGGSAREHGEHRPGCADEAGAMSSLTRVVAHFVHSPPVLYALKGALKLVLAGALVRDVVGVVVM